MQVGLYAQLSQRPAGFAVGRLQVASATVDFQGRRSAECGESAVRRYLSITTFRFEDVLLGGPDETNHRSLFAGEEAILGFGGQDLSITLHLLDARAVTFVRGHFKLSVTVFGGSH